MCDAEIRSDEALVKMQECFMTLSLEVSSLIASYKEDKEK
jgi:hypothetical protein